MDGFFQLYNCELFCRLGHLHFFFSGQKIKRFGEENDDSCGFYRLTSNATNAYYIKEELLHANAGKK